MKARILMVIVFLFGVLIGHRWTRTDPRQVFDTGVLAGCLEGVKLYKAGVVTNVIPELFKNVRAMPNLPEQYK